MFAPDVSASGQGLYRPHDERDACGVGFVVHMKGTRSHDIVRKALHVLINLGHRGACGRGVATRRRILDAGARRAGGLRYIAARLPISESGITTRSAVS